MPMTPAKPAPANQVRCLGDIERLRRPSPAEFYEEFHRNPRPVILEGLIDDWPAMKEWSTDFFREHYGDAEVPVGRCFGEKRYMPLGEYVDRMHELGAGEEGKPPLYMEGWYYKETRPDLQRYYEVPEHFGTDWFYTKRFPFDVLPEPHGVLIGPKGAFTKLHYDLWGSHSWNAQIVGRKQWIFVAPEYRRHVYLETRQNGGYVAGTDVDAPDLERWPRLAKVKYVTGVVHPGEMIFIPSLWMHQVLSLDDTISITHNYLSGNVFFRVLGRYLTHRFLKKQGI